MPLFNYSGVDNDNKPVKGSVEGMSKDAVSEALTKQGIKSAQIILATNEKKSGLSLFQPKVKQSDLVIFTRQLATMVSAGVPLLRALNTLQQQVEDKKLKEVIGDVCRDVEGGAQLADSLAKHPEVFSDIYINMVRAGEAAGIVDEILKRLATQEEKTASMRKKIKSASTYPLVLLVLTVVAFFGLMIFIIPTIGNVLKDLGGPDAELPVMTQMMLDFSDFMVKYWYIIIGIIGVIIFFIRRYAKTETGHLFFHRMVLKIPVLSTLITKIAVARFTRTFSALIGAGVSVVEALKVTARALGNKVFENEVLEATQRVINGSPLSKAIEASELFPAIVPQMLAVGEETGQTDVVLVKVADFYDEEVDATIDSLSSILEPVVIVIMGGAVGLIAVNVMGPIASMSQNIGN